jgi:probable DNA metabolism protein
VKSLAGIRQIVIEPAFDAWRKAARDLLQRGAKPEDIELVDAFENNAPSLFGASEAEITAAPEDREVRVPAEFVRRAEIVACHRDPQRWNLLYRLLWRMQSNRHLLRVEVDHDVAAFLKLEHQVKRDLHKMHAFVRFRKVEDEDGEHFIAWYEPAHHVLTLAAPFFRERFAVMRWSILTPDGTVLWDPQRKSLSFGPGMPRTQAPQADELEQVWRTYYKSIFNPARTNMSSMRSEMPVRYWKNLPEIADLPQLVQEADKRVQGMIARQTKASAQSFVPSDHALPVLAAAIPGCRGCELYTCATQPVFGRGPAAAKLMLVGEQPGDEEDLSGEPFVGPAGRLLNVLMAEAGLDRSATYVTNAVKHFKFKEVGRKRLHDNPRMSEILACRPWLQAEIETVKPSLVVCLGASAAKSLLGAQFAVTRDRGKILSCAWAERVVATFHPSAILRATVPAHATEVREALLSDLRLARELTA